MKCQMLSGMLLTCSVSYVYCFSYWIIGVFAGWFLGWFELADAGLLWEKNIVGWLNKSDWNQQANRAYVISYSFKLNIGIPSTN